MVYSEPNGELLELLPPSIILRADAWANSDLGLALPTCFVRRALSLAVQGLIMLSDGETYCLGL